MPNALPIFFIVLASLALILTLLWLWQSVRLAFIHTLAGPPASGTVSPERAALLAEKQALLLALKDLEAERESGKLSGTDYDDLNDQYRTRARDVLRQLDTLLAPHRDGAKALLAKVAAAPVSVAPPPPIAAPAETAAAASCKSCGASNDVDAVFCKRCGTRLQSGVAG
jgi:hypothetical protein